jgi:predicted nucleic acid-binding Zn ribbon protein
MEALQSFLPGAVRRLLRQGPLSQEKLEFAWQLAVGAAIDRVTSVRLSGESTVEVAVPDAGWRKEIRRSQGEILVKLRALLGAEAVRELRVTPGRTRGD